LAGGRARAADGLVASELFAEVGFCHEQTTIQNNAGLNRISQLYLRPGYYGAIFEDGATWTEEPMSKISIIVGKSDGTHDKRSIAKLDYDPVHKEALISEMRALASAFVGAKGYAKLIAIGPTGDAFAEVDIPTKDVGEL
jgi:hypothetical protein